MIHSQNESLDYFLSGPAPTQWTGFLKVLAKELSAQMSVVENRAFFRLLGSKMAEEHALGPVTTLADFQIRANAWLKAHGWGWVALSDNGAVLTLTHACSPLRSAFGDVQMTWAPALLEGLYSAWLTKVGASSKLELRQSGEPRGSIDMLVFELSLAPTA